MQQLITIIHVLVAICVIALVLIQRGKGADIGASFGSGASQTMFGSQGSTPFLVKLTGALALVFFITSGVLSFIIGKHVQQDNIFVTPTPTNTAVPVQMPGSALPPQATPTPSSAPTGMSPAPAVNEKTSGSPNQK